MNASRAVDGPATATPGLSDPSARPIVFVLAGLPMGGAEAQLTSLLEARPVDAGRPRVTILTLTRDRDDALVRRLKRLDVEIATVDRTVMRFPGFFLALVRWFRRARPTLVHTVLSGTPGTWGRLAARAAGVPIVVHSERSFAPARTVWQRRFEPLAHRLTDRFFTNARAVADRLEAEGVPAGKIRVLRNGVDVARFARADRAAARRAWNVDENAVVAGFLGSLRPVKRPDLLLDALAIVPEAERPDGVLFAGDGPLREGLRARVDADPWAREHVRFLGVVPDAAGFLAALDYLVLTSDTEGLPNAILEAMAAGVPCLATRVSDVPELVTDNGQVVEPGDAGGLADAIRTMQRMSADERRALGARGHARAKRDFELGVAAGRFWSAHDELLAARSALGRA